MRGDYRRLNAQAGFLPEAALSPVRISSRRDAAGTSERPGMADGSYGEDARSGHGCNGRGTHEGFEKLISNPLRDPGAHWIDQHYPREKK